jgi:RNA:NAD 2'-phosphotransferase (TPT1/KptA family)
MIPKLMTITPAIAAKFLENNPKNRPLSHMLIARLAKEMREGRWKVNGDMIRGGQGRSENGERCAG